MQAAAGSESLAGLTHSQKLALDTIDKGHKVLADLASAGEHLHHWHHSAPGQMKLYLCLVQSRPA